MKSTPSATGALTDERVVATRRLHLMQELAASGAAATSPREACVAAARVLEQSPDVTFALFYVAEGTGFDLAATARASSAVTSADWDPGHARVVDQGGEGPALVAPLGRGAETLGAAVIGLGPSRDVAFAQAIANQVGLALSGARIAALVDELRNPLALALAPLSDALSDDEHPLSAVQRERLGRARAGAQRIVETLEAAVGAAAPPVEAAAGPSRAEGPPAGTTGRVLIATGDGDLAAYLERLLGRRAFVETTPDFTSTLVAARENGIDVLLADTSLPGTDAAALLRALRTDTRTARLAVMLLGGEASRAELFAAGADECVSRPFDSRELSARISGALELARAREDALRRERAARAEAEAANRAKDEFLAMVSHELRSPLAAILIWTQLLRSERLDPATDRALGMIERSARTLTQIIDDLLDVSRIITGKLSLNPHPLDAAAVIDSAVSSAKSTADLKSVRLEVEVDRTVPPVFGDPGRLQQVVGNLLSNAIKFTGEDGRVVVRLDNVAGHARISVSDTGAGINPDFLPYIFERFRQADSTSTRTEKGLGLGLSIARHLVELHGGTIEAESAGEGRGSTFTVMLPLVPEQVLRSEVDTGESRPVGARELAGVRILLVDDDDDAREALAMLLMQWGADVISVGSAEHAFRALRSSRPHVLLSDIAMPGEDGYSLIRRVRSLPPVEGGDVPSAALTAYATAEDRNRALNAGFQDHLAKPVDPDRLLGVMLLLSRRSLP